MGIYSISEIRRQAYLLQKKFNLLPDRHKIVDGQEEDLGHRVLTELERETVEKWMDESAPYQDDFKLDAPPDFTLWKRQPDGTFIAAVGPRAAPCHSTTLLPASAPHALTCMPCRVQGAKLIDDGGKYEMYEHAVIKPKEDKAVKKMDAFISRYQAALDEGMYSRQWTLESAGSSAGTLLKSMSRTPALGAEGVLMCRLWQVYAVPCWPNRQGTARMEDHC